MQAVEEDKTHALRERLAEIDSVSDGSRERHDASDLLHDWWRECEGSGLRPGAILFSMEAERDVLLAALGVTIPRKTSGEAAYTRAFRSIVDEKQRETFRRGRGSRPEKGSPGSRSESLQACLPHAGRSPCPCA